MLHDNQPLAGLQITLSVAADGSSTIDFFGRPAFLRVDSAANKLTREKAEKLLAEEFLKLHSAHGSPSVNFLEPSVDGRLSDFTVALLKSGFSGAPLYKQVIDLSSPEEALWQDLRKSYKSLIHWSEKNLALTLYDHSTIKPEIMDQFRDLHISVAGRETRSPETWHKQYEQVLNQEAFVYLAHLGGQLVSSALFLYSPAYCLYGVSASIRELFDKPLAHGLIWNGMLQAKKRGCKYFEMGDLANLYGTAYSEKEKNIATFKSGFGGQARIFLKITHT